MHRQKMVLLVILTLALFSFMSVGCAAESGIIVNSVMFENVNDEYGIPDMTVVGVKAECVIPEQITQVGLIMYGGEIDDFSDEEEQYKIIYQTQVATPEDGVLRFIISKDALAKASGRDVDSIDGVQLHLKIGGNNLTVNTAYDVVYSDPDAVLYGDVTNDGEVDIGDAIQILRYEAGLVTFNARQMIAGEVTGDGEIDIGDAIRVLRFEAGLISSIK